MRQRRRRRDEVARRVAGEALAYRLSSLLTSVHSAVPTAGNDGAACVQNDGENNFVVAVYYDLIPEPPTGPLINALWNDFGVTRVLVPKPGVMNRAIDWAFDAGPSTQKAHVFGSKLAQPRGDNLGPQALASAQLILIPALCVDQNGTRLGQGGGWYDRALTWAKSSAVKIAVTYDDEVLAAGVLPRQTHDIAVDGVLTPQRLWQFGDDASPS